MNKQFVASVVGISSLLLLTACGGGGGGGNGTPHEATPPTTSPATVNVAASSAGARASATYNSGSAGNLIDGNTATSWISDPDSPIRVDFAGPRNISSFTLSRIASSATLGSNSDILIELSADGTSFSRSNVTMGGGIPCYSSTFNSTTIKCTMTPAQSVRAVRITTRNGKSFELTEFEAIAN